MIGATLTKIGTDKKGRFRADLKQGDFSIYINCVEQQSEECGKL